MTTPKEEQHGASPLPKGKRRPGTSLFKGPKVDQNDEKKERDLTGQTDTSLTHMKQRLREVPKKSAATKHDKDAYKQKPSR
ncbi:MAG TPA: hypothetical protein VG737_02965 [Cyclobacteriaceae bacterium]|nr:hypothetical protein [Cyclobacteriaceae bacterium]